MSRTGLAVFDRTLQVTNHWLNELIADLDLNDRRAAYDILRVVLHALRDRLVVNEAVDLAAQLPLLVRGIYYEGWVPAKTPTRERRQEQFLAHIGEALPANIGVSPADAVFAVFAMLETHISEGEMEQIYGMLPTEIRALRPTVVD